MILRLGDSSDRTLDSLGSSVNYKLLDEGLLQLHKLTPFVSAMNNYSIKQAHLELGSAELFCVLEVQKISVSECHPNS